MSVKHSSDKCSTLIWDFVHADTYSGCSSWIATVTNVEPFS
jgi:hypothetical protein